MSVVDLLPKWYKKVLLNGIYLMKSWLLVRMKNGTYAFCRIQFERVLSKNYGTIIFSVKIQPCIGFGLILYKSMKSVCLLCGNMLRIRRQNVAI